MIKKFNFDISSPSPNGGMPLPKGGYVIKIKAVKVAENKIGQYLAIEYDIAEGTYAGYWQARYDSWESDDKQWKGIIYVNIPNENGSKEDSWSIARFKAFITALMRSNPGYIYDSEEQHFVGLIVGGLFNLKEIRKADGEKIRVTNFARFSSVDTIRNGAYTLPKDQLLSANDTSEGSSGQGSGEVSCDDEFPFK